MSEPYSNPVATRGKPRTASVLTTVKAFLFHIRRDVFVVQPIFDIVLSFYAIPIHIRYEIFDMRSFLCCPVTDSWHSVALANVIQDAFGIILWLDGDLRLGLTLEGKRIEEWKPDIWEKTDIFDINPGTPGDSFLHAVMTASQFESVLKESPTMLHVSTHGSHHYKATEPENEFQISFEETHILRALIDEDTNFSACYAVIAMLFEIEMNHFVQYGLKHSAKHNQSLRTYIWCDASRFALLMNDKIYAMFRAILDRFGMHSHAREGGCIEIYWGRYEYVNKKLVFATPPHAPIDAFQLKTLYSVDENVQVILKTINDDYNRALACNLTIAEALKEHQMFSWEILSILLHRMLNEVNEYEYAHFFGDSDSADKV
eukprot:634931_1